MVRAYGMDLRHRVVTAIEGGHVDAGGGASFFDQYCGGRSMGAAEESNRQRGAAQTGQAARFEAGQA